MHKAAFGLTSAGLCLGGFAALAADDAAKAPESSGQPAAGSAAAPAATQSQAPSPAPAQSGQAPTAPAAGGQAAAGGGEKPPDLVASTPKGQLKNPYADFAKVADEGHQKFMAAGCNGCHGGTGGGGMGPPLTNQAWVYGKDDDTLFRLVTLGSVDLQKQGYARGGAETAIGPMPPMGGVVKSDEDLWKIIAWIRSVNPSSASTSASTAPSTLPPQ